MGRLEILVTISVLLQVLMIWRRPVVVVNNVVKGGGTDGTENADS